MLQAVKTYGSLQVTKAIFPGNKRVSNELIRCQPNKLDTWDEWQQSEYKKWINITINKCVVNHVNF